MSYILDALKKSESERGHGAVPGVQTVHSSSINYHKEKTAIWPYFLILAVLINAGVIGYFIYTQNQNETGETTVVATVPAKPDAAVSVPATHVTAIPPANIRVNDSYQSPAQVSPAAQNISAPADISNTKPVAPATIEENTETSIPAQVSTTTQTDKEREIETWQQSQPESPVEYHDLPEQTQRELPTFTISAHVYSSNPQQRSMVINNQYLEEGDHILDGLILYEITPDGAIFNYNGLLFHNGVVSGWQ